MLHPYQFEKELDPETIYKRRESGAVLRMSEQWVSLISLGRNISQ